MLESKYAHIVVIKTNNELQSIITFCFTSNAFPNPLAKGNVIKLGTKKTGNHLANNVAPGLNVSYTTSPHFSLAMFNNIINVNKVPHPAKLDGNGIEYC